MQRIPQIPFHVAIYVGVDLAAKVLNKSFYYFFLYELRFLFRHKHRHRNRKTRQKNAINFYTLLTQSIIYIPIDTRCLVHSMRLKIFVNQSHSQNLKQLIDAIRFAIQN